MPGKMARSAPRPSVRVTRGARSGQHLASVLQEGRESANIDAGLGFIRRISVETIPVSASELIDDIIAYELQHGAPGAGSVSERVLRKIVELSPKPLRYSAETGAGKTTVLLSHLADHHLCFTCDDREVPWQKRSNLDFVQNCPLFRFDKITFVLGPTQRTLPSYKFSHMIDVALIDGAHGYPFPEMDYYFFYPHLRAGALLIVDDINIPTIRRLAQFLSEDEMFEQIHVEGNTAFFRRTTAETFNPEGDGWTLQRFNVNRYKAPDAHPWRRIKRKLRPLAQKISPGLVDLYSRSRGK